MNHRTSRGGGYGRETGIIDLGHEPPLSVDGSEAAVIDRRRVSVQWFSGTILTGLCGAALIGGAVFASLDGEMTFAKIPERVEGALRGGFGAKPEARPIACRHAVNQVRGNDEAAIEQTLEGFVDLDRGEFTGKHADDGFATLSCAYARSKRAVEFAV